MQICAEPVHFHSMSASTGIAAIPRQRTGIHGLDDVLGGGLPGGRLYLVRGDPGTGKTTLGMQFLLEGRNNDERCLYVTLSESEEELCISAASHGWSLEGTGLVGLAHIEALLQPQVQTTLLHPAEHELGRALQVIQDKVRELQPARVVIDSLSELRLMAQNPLRFRRHILALKSFFASCGATVLLLDMEPLVVETAVQTLVHGVIELQMRNPEYGPARRRLSITKLRGVKYRAGYHDFLIATGGLDVFPRLVAAEHAGEPQVLVCRSGIAELDQLLGGGIEHGTSTLVVGAAGTGKSSLALQYAIAACRDGGRCAYFTFDESLTTLRRRVSGLGMSIDALTGAGNLSMQQVDPAELTPGEFTAMTRKRVENDGVRMVVVDSLNGYLQSMPDEKLLTTQLHELLTYLAHRGVATILLMTQHGIVGQVETPVDLSYLADTVIFLRYFEFSGALKKAISVVKKRSGGHEQTLRELRLVNGRGIVIGDPLEAFRGVTTGVPTYTGTGTALSGSLTHGG
jgi:circadian clock protein KaiC